MKSKTLIPIITLLCVWQSALFAQEKLNIKFGKITAADFNLSNQSFDTSAGAVVIADIGKSAFEGNNSGWFSLSFSKHSRVKILNKNGMDAANVEIVLYTSGTAEERVANIKASTYTLEGGRVVETQLDKKSIFKDKYDKNFNTVKFTLPAVKEGVIIEYTYTITSDFIRNLQPWEFQGEYPILWSEYEVKMPDFFRYVFLTQGRFQVNHTAETSRENFTVVESRGSSSSERYSFSASSTRHRWVAKNVPALKMESFTTTMQNYIAKIEFQLQQFRFPDAPVKDMMGNWVNLATDLMKDADFGEGLMKNNSWLDEELNPVVRGSEGNLDKAKKIYAYVRDRYTSAGRRGIYLSTGLRTISKNKNGYATDINLLLTAMMKQQGIEAYPVLLSTRDHGYTNELYPLINRFNYVVCAVKIEGVYYYLDATSPLIGFNYLPGYCYNGHARIIMPETSNATYFDADSLKEKKLTTVFLRSEKPGEWNGASQTQAGYFESLTVRESVKEKGEESFFKNIQTSYTGDITLSNQTIEQLKELEKPVKVKFNFRMKMDEDIVYFNPMMWEGYKENYFKAAERSYPVEMPFVFDETYIFNLDVPEDYVVEEVPRSAKVNLNDTDGFFEYLVENAGTAVRLRSRIKLNRANFRPEEYNDLREFFSYVVKKHAEPIVLKKKK